MRRLIVGLVLVPLVALSSVSVVGAQSSTESDGSRKVQPEPNQGRALKNNKQVSKTPYRAAPPSSSLSSAEAYAVEHSGDLPVSSSAKPASPATYPWTGFHVGAGIGAGQQ
jgi:hypothetical protein